MVAGTSSFVIRFVYEMKEHTVTCVTTDRL